MMQELGLNVKVIDSRWGEGANEAKLAEVLKVSTRGNMHRKCSIMLCMHYGQ